MKVFPTDLIEGCKKENSNAQRSLFDFYYDYMFNVCLRYVKDQMLAEDMLSQGFTKVFKNIRKFNLEHDNGLRGWIKRIMINECLMLLRKKNNFCLVPLTEAETLAAEEISLEKLDADFILQSIAELPIGYRTVLNLNLVEGYSHGEISAMLHIKEATSRSQLNKARQVLKQKLLYYKLNNYGKG
ncbi:MAG: sigma-70 family RNA polymerase sigma factor [Bacteroidota bacterium]